MCTYEHYFERRKLLSISAETVKRYDFSADDASKLQNLLVFFAIRECIWIRRVVRHGDCFSLPYLTQPDPWTVSEPATSPGTESSLTHSAHQTHPTPRAAGRCRSSLSKGYFI